jgi:hypothetical protein
VKPTIQLGSGVFVFSITGLFTGIILGKALVNSSVKPLFIEAFIDRALSNPLGVRCCFLLMI